MFEHIHNRIVGIEPGYNVDVNMGWYFYAKREKKE